MRMHLRPMDPPEFEDLDATEMRAHVYALGVSALNHKIQS